jgi:hypothetical protein
LVEWLKNTGWEALGDIPVLGASVRGLKTTLEKTNSAMQEMHTDMDEQLRESLKTELPTLKYYPPKLPAPEPDCGSEQP